MEQFRTHCRTHAQLERNILRAYDIAEPAFRECLDTDPEFGFICLVFDLRIAIARFISKQQKIFIKTGADLSRIFIRIIVHADTLGPVDLLRKIFHIVIHILFVCTILRRIRRICEINILRVTGEQIHMEKFSAVRIIFIVPIHQFFIFGHSMPPSFARFIFVHGRLVAQEKS